MTGSSPTFMSSPKAFHTPFDPSTILFRHGGWWACALSHPFIESHSSTTLATTDLPFLAVILIFFPHLEPPLYQPVDNATIGLELSWNLPSHSDGSPPSPPLLKSLFVRMARVEEVTRGEHLNWGKDFPLQFKLPKDWQPLLEDGGNFPPPPPFEQIWVPTTGSSLHWPFIQINWPLQSLRVWHGPLQEEIARERLGRETMERKRGTSKAKFAMGRWLVKWRKRLVFSECDMKRSELAVAWPNIMGTKYFFWSFNFLRCRCQTPRRGKFCHQILCIVASCFATLSLFVILTYYYDSNLES